MAIANTQKPLTFVAKSTILDTAALSDPLKGLRFIKCLYKTSLYI